MQLSSAVANDLHLEFLPADDRFFDQHFLRRRGSRGRGRRYRELFAVIRDAAPVPPSVKQGRIIAGKSDLSSTRRALRKRVGQHRPGRREANLVHGTRE